MGPLNLPEAPRKRRWVWLILWTLLVFAGGVVAGPTVTNQALVILDRGYSMLGMSSPQFVEKLKPAAPRSAPLIEPLPAAGSDEETGAPSVAAAPAAARAEKPAQADKPAAATAPQPTARAMAVATQGRPESAAAGKPVAHPSHAKSEARAPSARASARTADSASAPATAGYHDPFVDDAESTPAPAAPSRKSKPALDELAPAEKSEPTPKPAASGSRDSLDSLMADVVTDTKGKGKPREGKGLDAILNDVQKGKPEPQPQREAPAALPPLAQADITRVMAGVKTRGKDCARQFGKDGIAELKLAVGKDGSVTNVSVGGKLANTPVAACIEKAARAAAFPRSAGLRFDYRIDVR
jgi:hypothetical protein